MAHVVVLGAGLGGTIQAYELKDTLTRSDKITVISNKPYFQFTPSNPWAGVGWRSKDEIIVDLAPVMKRRGIDFICDAAEKLVPDENKIVLASGKEVTYDYLVIATGPELAFDEIEGFGPDAHTNSVCQIEHAEKSGGAGGMPGGLPNMPNLPGGGLPPGLPGMGGGGGLPPDLARMLSKGKKK